MSGGEGRATQNPCCTLLPTPHACAPPADTPSPRPAPGVSGWSFPGPPRPSTHVEVPRFLALGPLGAPADPRSPSPSLPTQGSCGLLSGDGQGRWRIPYSVQHLAHSTDSKGHHSYTPPPSEQLRVLLAKQGPTRDSRCPEPSKHPRREAPLRPASSKKPSQMATPCATAALAEDQRQIQDLTCSQSRNHDHS